MVKSQLEKTLTSALQAQLAKPLQVGLGSVLQQSECRWGLLPPTMHGHTVGGRQHVAAHSM